MLFPNHTISSSVLKHEKLPIYKTTEFCFFRCVNIDSWVYGKTISELHAGNLRQNKKNGRYSKLFPNEKISYWADSKSTALSEIKKHGSNNNYLTFWAYDDASSTFPTLNINEKLVIIDGRQFDIYGTKLEFHKILLKIQNDEKLTPEENKLVELIKQEQPDCLAYKSVEKNNGVNFLFFEKGFKKLALREISLYFGERKAKNTKRVLCANSSDYSPIIENYGKYFKPIVKVKTDTKYENTKEYKLRKKSLSNLRKGD